jgi:hypothetical protein
MPSKPTTDYRLLTTSLLIYCLAALLFPTAISASPAPLSLEKPQTFSITDIADVIAAVILNLFAIAAVLLFLYLIWGGIQYVTSGGQKDQITAAHSRITAALIGLSIIASGYAVMLLVNYFFGLDIFGNITLPKGF